VRDVLTRTLSAAAPHAEALGCAAELEVLHAPGGCARQRAVAARGDGLEAVVEDLAGAFVP
jgi:hypothetical protein